MAKRTDPPETLLSAAQQEQQEQRQDGAAKELAPRQDVSMFERLARDPDVSVEKLERLIQLQERVMTRQAEEAFNEAFVALQAALPVVVERAKTDKGTYAPLEDIIDAVRPVLHQHGFSLSHQTQWPAEDRVKVVALLTHARGHQRTSEFLSEADKSGSKNAIQALASAVSYGRRYTTNDVLGMVTRGEDDDGARGVPLKVPEEIEEWLAGLEDVSVEGTAALEKAWHESSETRRLFVLQNAGLKARWNALKAKAARVKR